ncbi:MAG: malonyl-CoA synthase [Hyphomicrobiales bacterium]|nr:malonyl-CoA synthase [Hyphomicrobiales bacterium]
MSDNLFSILRSHFPQDETSEFILTGSGRVVTYADLLASTARFANALVALGVVPGERVAVQVDKSVEALMLYLATLRAGGVFLPLNTAYTASELAYFLGDAEPVLTICRPENLSEIAAIAKAAGVARVETLGADGDGSLLDHVAAAEPSFADVARAGDDLAAILYTSGTTGRSKGAMLTHRNLSSNAQALAETWRFTAADRLLHALPIFHTHGLFTATNTVLMTGGSMLFLPRFDAQEVLELLPDATAMMGVPTFYIRLLQQPELTAELVSHIRVFISGSAPLSPEVHTEFAKRTGQAILERYGMTETGMNTSNPLDGERRAGTVGFPLPGIQIRIADAKTGAAVEAGEIGVIEIKGPNVFKGYWRMPEKTAEELREDGFFISGDLGLIDDRGYLNIVGRDKDLIISGGFNVYPAEIEAAIDSIPGVVETAVIGAPHPDLGEAVTAVVVCNAGAEVDEASVMDRLDGELARFKQPKCVFFVDTLPRNAMGKIQKKELRETFKNTYS